MKTRVLLLLLCGCAAASAAGQAAPTRPPMRVNRGVLQQMPDAVTPATLTMPDVRLLRPDGAAVQLRRDLHLVPSFTGDGPIVVAQDPPPGASVNPDTQIVLTLGVPQLSVAASTATPAAGEDVVFQAVADPTSGEIVYTFAWNDGSGELETTVPQATHRFTETGTYEVVVSGRLLEMELGPVISTISVVAPPPPNVTDTIATDTTATAPVLTTADATQPPVDVPAPPVPVEPPPLDSQPEPPSIPWLTIALVAAAVVAVAGIARAVARKPPAPAGPPPRVAIRSGLGSTDHTIEHPEQIRNGFSLRLRGGIRSTVAGEGGADA